MLKFLAGIATAFTVAGSAQATVTVLNSQAAFSALGTISQYTNFDTASYPTYPSNPLVIGDLTFPSGNVIAGEDYGFGNTRKLLMYSSWSPLMATISGSHDLLGFTLGSIAISTDITISLTTNKSTYSFYAPFSDPSALEFFGFAASAGETFQSIALYSTIGPGSAAGITDLQLGVAAVPEPAEMAMLIAGLALIAALGRRQRERK